MKTALIAIGLCAFAAIFCVVIAFVVLKNYKKK